MKLGSLFSGIGGFELAGEWCGHRTIWQSEIDPYCVSLLSERFPDARQLGDIRTIDWSTVERPDIITGGFPCQDISGAGKGAGLEGARSGLWFEFARCIHEVRPSFVIVENVRRLLTIHAGRDFGIVLGTLADLGYDAEWSMYGASDVGSPHSRERIWILAYPNGGLRKGSHAEVRAGRDAAFAGCEVVVNCGGSRRASRVSGSHTRQEGNASQYHYAGDPVGWGDAVPVEGCDGTIRLVPREVAEAGPQSSLWPVAYGVPGRVVQLRGVGNAIVPRCALPIFRRIRTIAAR